MTRWPQAGQATGSGVPHSLQNLLRSATFARQLGQSMQHPTCSAGARLVEPPRRT
jgi:hypothetical protein